MNAQPHPALNRRLVDSLYMEAMLLADEARAYFDMRGRADREELPSPQRVSYSCESLRVTTRLMHIIAWLLTRRAVAAGEISEAQAVAPERRLGHAQGSDPEMVAALPEPARQIIDATAELYDRVRWLDEDMSRRAPAISPARHLIGLLEQAF